MRISEPSASDGILGPSRAGSLFESGGGRFRLVPMILCSVATPPPASTCLIPLKCQGNDTPLMGDVPMSKRLGEILKARGYISDEQLQQALRIQAQPESHKLMGQILTDQGLLTGDQAQLFSYCQTLLDVVAQINSTNDLHSLLSAITQAACRIMETEASSLILRDRESEELIITVPTEPAGTDISGIRIPAGSGCCGWVINQGEPLLVQDVSSDPRFYQEIDSSSGFQTRNLACVPLRTPKGEIIGALEAINRLNNKDFTEADLPLFSVLADQATIALERARLQQESVEKQLLEKELGLAYEIQKGFWPKQLPSYPDFSVAAMSLPARHVGGDYYDFIPLNPNVWAVAIGDVSGKGTSAALLMSSLRTMLRTQVENGLSVEETIYRLNNILIKDTPLDKFSSLLYGILDFEAREFTYVNAGHPPPLLYDSTIPDVRSLGLVGGPPIGIQENLRITPARQKLRSGQAMILFTDGIPEARSQSGEFFGEEGLRSVVAEHTTGPAQTLMEQIHGAVQDFAQGQPLADDLTLIVIKAEGRGSSLSDREG